MTMRWLFDQSFWIKAAFWVVITVLALVAVKCGGDRGMYQGGGDDTPRWR